MDELERAFREHYVTVYRYLRRRTGDDRRAEELAQEVFADAAAALPDFGKRAPSPLAWLYTVAQRRFADDVRRLRREQSQAGVSLNGATPYEYAPELRAAIVAALARLPADQRRVLGLKLVRGLPFAAVARELGTGEPAARMRFVRALRSLREELEKEEVER